VIEKTVKTICLLVLVMGLVSLASADSMQSIAVSQEFDDSGNVQDATPSNQTVPAQRVTIGKQDLSAANARSNHAPPSSVAPNDQKTPQSGDSGWKDTLSSLLPSKQDLDKALNAESSSGRTPTRTNWR
jgi:hypothetical protein